MSSAPSGAPLGCRDQNSTYERQLLCHLAYKALQGFVGEDAANLVLHFPQNHHYLWVYRTIESDKAYVESLIVKHALYIGVQPVKRLAGGGM